MTGSRRFQINPQIVNETIQGEVVAIDLKTGSYYSLTGVAAEVWTLLAQPIGVHELTDALSARYDASANDIASATATFIENLQTEGLIVASSDGAPRPRAVRDTASAGAAFVAPVLQKYADMQDLLLIDPIHEVGEAGWPSVAAAKKLEL